MYLWTSFHCLQYNLQIAGISSTYNRYIDNNFTSIRHERIYLSVYDFEINKIKIIHHYINQLFLDGKYKIFINKYYEIDYNSINKHITCSFEENVILKTTV